MEPLFEGHGKLTCFSAIAPQISGKFYVSMGVGYISADEHTVYTERVLCVYRALFYRSLRMSRILLGCTFIRRVLRTVLNMLKIVHGIRCTKRLVTNQKCWCSALDERVMNDDEQWCTNHFSARSSCILHAFTWCDRALTQVRLVFHVTRGLVMVQEVELKKHKCTLTNCWLFCSCCEWLCVQKNVQ